MGPEIKISLAGRVRECACAFGEWIDSKILARELTNRTLIWTAPEKSMIAKLKTAQGI